MVVVEVAAPLSEIVTAIPLEMGDTVPESVNVCAIGVAVKLAVSNWL